MARDTNIKIITFDGRLLDYTTPESLNIKLNRISDDYRNPDKRWGEYSYNFSLPKTKNNAKIFEFADNKSKKNKFKVNPLSIRLYNNDKLLVDGTLELRKIKEKSYECIVFSKLTQLVDDLGKLNLQDLTNMPQISGFTYETNIAIHINANYDNSDEADWQFPLVYYNTFYTPYGTYSGLTDTLSYPFGTAAFRCERSSQNYYYLLNRTQTGVDNELYYHQIPMAFYLKFIMNKMLDNIGWSMGGSFWDDANIKKIIVPYVGNNDIYDQAQYCSNGDDVQTGGVCSGGTLMLDTGKFLPKYDCKKFLKDVINTFNLYYTIDINQKIINFETYDIMFGSRAAPYNITDKLLYSTINIDRIDQYDPTVSFTNPSNDLIMGDNYYIGSYSGTNALYATYKKTSSALFNEVYSHIGITSGEVKIGFGAPCIKRIYVRNTDNYTGSITNAQDQIMFIPNLSKQTPRDNNNCSFNKATGDTINYDKEDTVKYDGLPTLMYYYGISDCNFIQQAGKGDSSDYFYFDFNNIKQKIGIASPFALKTFRDNINTTLNLNDSGTTETIYASYLQSIYMMMGSGVTSTDISLTFGDSELCPTLYNKYHQKKYDRYRNSEMLSATIRLNNIDWSIMTFNQPLLYNGEIYSLLSIKNYDVISGLATIEIIKHI
jgi:hypothetical protein